MMRYALIALIILFGSVGAEARPYFLIMGTGDAGIGAEFGGSKAIRDGYLLGIGVTADRNGPEATEDGNPPSNDYTVIRDTEKDVHTAVFRAGVPVGSSSLFVCLLGGAYLEGTTDVLDMNASDDTYEGEKHTTTYAEYGVGFTFVPRRGVARDMTFTVDLLRRSGLRVGFGFGF